MNKYLALVTGPKDSLGFDFLKNVIQLASKGAVLTEGKVPSLRFPHQAWMSIETEELLEDKPGFQFQIVCENLTREQLEALDWDSFKRQLRKQFGITGRNREQMTREYLKLSSGEESSEDKE